MWSSKVLPNRQRWGSVLASMTIASYYNVVGQVVDPLVAVTFFLKFLKHTLPFAFLQAL